MKIEQSELRDAARQLLEGVGPTAGPDAIWQAICEAGWCALTAPEDLGGLEQSLTAACWLYLELGRALSPAPLLTSLLGVEALMACPQSAARDAYLERIVGGERIATTLLDPSAADLQRSASGAFSGTIAGVQGASAADLVLIVSAKAKVVALVPLNASGVSTISHPLWDQSRELSDLVLSNVGCEAGWILARGAEAEPAIMAVSTHLHCAIAADCVGAADEILRRTVAYLQERRQFDRPLAMFQALKHRCADLKAAVSAAEALLADHLNTIEQGQAANALVLARGAKSLASTTFHTVTEESVQLHGGMGMTAEHPCHLFLKRALLNEHLASPDDACDLAVAADFLLSLGM